MNILAIDPGPLQSGWVLFDPEEFLPLKFGVENNAQVLRHVRQSAADELAMEWMEHYGKAAVGQSVFHTARWVGRFEEAWESTHPWPAANLYKRREIKLQLCDTARCGDPQVRQAILDRYPPDGGGKVPQIGTLAEPGPLYGIKSHLWSALAVAITHAELRGKTP